MILARFGKSVAARFKRTLIAVVALSVAGSQQGAGQDSPIPQARPELGSVRRLTVHIDRVDGALIDFGLDTARLRESIEARLVSSGLTVSDSADGQFVARFGVEIGVVRPVSPSSEPGALLAIRVERFGAESTRAPRVIWKSRGAIERVPSYRMLAQLVSRLAERAGASFLAAHEEARRAMKAPQ